LKAGRSGTSRAPAVRSGGEHSDTRPSRRIVRPRRAPLALREREPQARENVARRRWGGGRPQRVSRDAIAHALRHHPCTDRGLAALRRSCSSSPASVPCARAKTPAHVQGSSEQGRPPRPRATAQIRPYRQPGGWGRGAQRVPHRWRRSSVRTRTTVLRVAAAGAVGIHPSFVVCAGGCGTLTGRFEEGS
jgi:hypothetical protein